MENKAAREEFKFKDDSEEEEDLLGKENEIAKMRAALAKSKFCFISQLSFRFTARKFIDANLVIELE